MAAKDRKKAMRLTDHVKKETVLADATILDYFIHQSIEYRLDLMPHLFEDKDEESAQPLYPESELNFGLEIAFSYSKSAENMMRLLEAQSARLFDNQDATILFDSVARIRRSYAKIIGLCFFMTNGECGHFEVLKAHRGPCCVRHAMVLGWRSLVNIGLLATIGQHANLAADIYEEINLNVRTAVVVHGARDKQEAAVLLDEMFAPSGEDRLDLMTQAHDDDELYRRLFLGRREKLLQGLEGATFAVFRKKWAELASVEKTQRELLNFIRAAYGALKTTPNWSEPRVIVAARGIVSSLDGPNEEESAPALNRTPGKVAETKEEPLANSRATPEMSGRPSSAKRPALIARHESAERVPFSDNGSATPLNSPRKYQRARTRTTWSRAETAELIALVRKHGHGKWALIRDNARAISEERTQVDLKDKARNILRQDPAAFAK